MRLFAFIIVMSAFAFWMWQTFFAPLPTPVQSPPPIPLDGELSADDSRYHATMFEYALNTVTTPVPFEWKAYSGRGNITLTPAFKSKSGAICRNYQETIMLAKGNVHYAGVACKRRGEAGWCRLRENAEALSCAFEKAPLIPSVNVPGVHVETPEINPQMPNVNAGGIGQVGTPDIYVPAPQGSNTDELAPRETKAPGTGVADTVTGAAGSAAGPVAGGAIKWFNQIFR